jgi:uncharacterized protein YajQ (UPF0234 family)
MPSFDIVSRTDLQEVDNAVQGAMREITTRYDFKGGHLAKRKVDAGAFDFAKPEKASGNTVRQTVTIKQGIERDLAQQVMKMIKGAKLKVQVAIQGDELRISGKKRDDLQGAIALVKEAKITQPLQYVNFRD